MESLMYPGNRSSLRWLRSEFTITVDFAAEICGVSSAIMSDLPVTLFMISVVTEKPPASILLRR